MAQATRTARAEPDLLDIGLFLAERSPASADRVLNEIERVCSMLAESPSAGRTREEFQPGLRSFPVGSFVVFYRPIEDGILVVRVLHGARDIPELL